MSPSLPRRPEMRRAVVLLPNGATLANLFFGVWAIERAAQGAYYYAVWYILLGGVMDALDGRIARATRTGSAFGIELDSLVDAISFGVAPAMLMYFAVLNKEGWAWVLCFLFIACVVMRLARFNVEQGGHAKTHFHGLPSPAAGMTLATYWWFSQTTLYNTTFVATLPWHSVIPWLMIILSFLMISHVLYPAVPTIGFKSVKGLLGLTAVLATIAGLIFKRQEFIFPALCAYVGWGLLRTVVVGLMERLPSGDPLNEDDEPDEELRAEIDPNAERAVELGDHPVRERRRGGERRMP
ncbi:MAG: CDP-diacylglycerol--serine O-phosphatidyltransferase [Gemmatimonadaceae bacterium]